MNFNFFLVINSVFNLHPWNLCFFFCYVNFKYVFFLSVVRYDCAINFFSEYVPGEFFRTRKTFAVDLLFSGSKEACTLDWICWKITWKATNGSEEENLFLEYKIDKWEKIYLFIDIVLSFLVFYFVCAILIHKVWDDNHKSIITIVCRI